jgi:hypothetical protein
MSTQLHKKNCLTQLLLPLAHMLDKNRIIYLKNGTIWYMSPTEQAMGPEIFQKLQAIS